MYWHTTTSISASCTTWFWQFQRSHFNEWLLWTFAVLQVIYRHFGALMHCSVDGTIKNGRKTRWHVDCVWNVMAHAQKDFVFRRNGRVHLERRGRQFSRLLAAEVCASAVVMLDTPRSEVVWRVLATHSIRQFPLHFPFLASPCAITFQLDSTTLHEMCEFWGTRSWVAEASVLWDMTLHEYVIGFRRFESISCPHLRGVE